MKTAASLRIVSGFILLECLFLFAGCFNDKKTQGPGNSTEAENALALILVDKNNVARKGVHAILCEDEAVCTNPLHETRSDDSGAVFIDSIPDGSYYLTCILDTLQGSLLLFFANGDTLNLGRVAFSDGGLTPLDTVAVSLWTGKWVYQSADTNTQEESITTQETGFLFNEDSSLTYWTYSWKVGYGSNVLEYARSESLFVEAKWNDAGLALNLFPSADSILKLMNTAMPEYGLITAHVIMTPVVSNPRQEKWSSGFVFSFQNDSLLLLGDLKIFTGNSTVLAGSSWTYLSDNGDAISDIVQMSLNADSSVTLIEDDVSYTDGAWSISATGRLTITWNSGASSLQGYYAIHDGYLWIMDLDDASTFHKKS